MKKVWICLVIALLALGIGCAGAKEHPGYDSYRISGDWVYVVNGNMAAEIIFYNGTDSHVTIPSMLDGLPVTTVWYGTFSENGFTSTRSPVKVTIPDTVTKIIGNPFNNCPKLTEIVITPDHPTLALIDGVLFDKQEKELLFYPQTKTASHYAIPSGIRSIGAWAFARNEKLVSITIPQSVTKLGEGAFAGCGLTYVALPEGVKEIPDSAFDNCPLENIRIPASVTRIGANTFFGCEMASVILPQNLVSIGDCAFACCYYLTGISIPDSVSNFGQGVFRSCTALEQIRVSPDHPTLSVINGVLFDEPSGTLLCYPSSLRASSYVVPQGVRVIGEYAFVDARLHSVTLPDSLVTIEANAFSDCRSLRGVSIPEGVRTIGASAFFYCDALTALTIPDSVTHIGGAAFECWPETVVTLTVGHNSYARQYAIDNGIPYTYADANSWLYD